MTIHEATKGYESWLNGQIPLIRKDLNHKHAAMRKDAFSFLRATFYRWAEKFPASLRKAPPVLGVGDLHVENFGTWRDSEGRLVWGVNDFDEACRLPYTNDLVRLATSALIATRERHPRIPEPQLCAMILTGYRDGLEAGGCPFVLAEKHGALRDMAVERLKEPEKFWNRFDALPKQTGKIPAAALKGLRRDLPAKDVELRIGHRLAGLGSLGRRRYSAIGPWRGARIAREVKELAVSAWYWAHGRADKEKIRYEQILKAAVRCSDPFLEVRGRWIARRLAPDCSRIELSDLPREHDVERLLHAMGFETANVHLGNASAKALLADLSQRPAAWFADAAELMVRSTLRDWKAWKK